MRELNGQRAHAIRVSRVLVAVAVLLATATACKGGRGWSIGGPGSVSNLPPPAAIGTRTIHGLGQVLVGPNGHTLYVFAADRQQTSACYGECLHDWQPMRSVTHHPTARGDAQQALLGSFTRNRGKIQVTYDGRPLYYYTDDTQPGQAKGAGLTQHGGTWYAASPNGGPARQRQY